MFSNWNQKGVYIYTLYSSYYPKFDRFVNNFRRLRAKCLHWLFTGKFFN